MTVFEIPTVMTARLRLRAFQADDLEAYAAMQANPEVMRYLLTGHTATRIAVWYTMLTSLGAWALRGYGMWAVEKIAGDVFVGSVGVFEPLDWPEPEIAYSLDQPFWHQGFARAAAARDWLFAQFARPRRQLRPPTEPASIRVAERLGATCEGTIELRGATFQHWVHRLPPDQPAGRPATK
jgi:RimJ/RimL family protein N-acetyltransferase